MIVLFWIFFAVVTAIVANNNNRNVPLWSVLGLLFGVFAFVIVLILPKEE